MRKALASAALAGVAFAFSGSCFAQGQGVYLGGSIGQAEAGDWCDSEPGFVVTACDDKDTGWKVFLGYRVNRNFAVEGSYMNGGEYSGTVSSFLGTASVTSDATAWGVSALGILPVSEQFELFGKLGFVAGESDADVTIGGTRFTVGDSGTELTYGIGAVYNLTRSFGVRAEWENVDDAEISMLSVGVQFKFQ